MPQNTIAHDLKDWPRALRLNVVTIDLARQIYVAECLAWGGLIAFDDLTPEIKSVYTSLAANILQARTPSNLLAFVKPASREKGGAA